VSLGDTLAGLHAAFGAVMALYHRDRHRGGSGGTSDTAGDASAGAAKHPSRSGGGGGGQVVDAAITESVFNMLEAAIAEAAASGAARPPSGSTISGVVPSGTFRTKDGRYAVIGGNGDSVYSRLMVAIGRPDMAADAGPRFASNAARVEAEAEIMGEIEAWCVRARACALRRGAP
jgi:crotonobetainyl-CoA:carnitine CoA-transferase CaiB-like acyl-CoA transferase